MKKQRTTKIEKKILLAQKHKESIKVKTEDQPIRLGDDLSGDKVVFMRKSSDALLRDVAGKTKLTGRTSGSHSLTALRSFRSK